METLLSLEAPGTEFWIILFVLAAIISAWIEDSTNGGDPS